MVVTKADLFKLYISIGEKRRKRELHSCTCLEGSLREGLHSCTEGSLAEARRVPVTEPNQLRTEISTGKNILPSPGVFVAAINACIHA
eukprot:1145847-Pelagomonas_calceolata.AAC.2